MSRILLAALAVVAIATPTAVSAEASGSCPYHANGDAIPPEKWHQRAMPDDYSGGLKEFSVVYTDRALNHMSAPFIEVMNDLNDLLKGVYNAAATVILPGSGTYGMEAVARQFARGEKALVVRNGYFSYRWTDIFEQTQIASEVVVLKATLDTTDTDASRSHVKPLPIDTIVEAIKKEKPKVVFAPHVETSTGVMFPDDQVKAIADAAHSVGAVFVLDCIASGTYWVDMKALGIDVVITAPQKGWSGHACAGKFIFISVRAIRMTPCFVHRRRHALRSRRGSRPRRAGDEERQHDAQPAQVARRHGHVRRRRVQLLHHHAHRLPPTVSRRRVRDARVRIW